MPDNKARIRASRQSQVRVFQTAKNLKRIRLAGATSTDELTRSCRDLLEAAKAWNESGRQRGAEAGVVKTRPQFTTLPCPPTEPYQDSKQYVSALMLYASKYAWDVRDDTGEAQSSAAGLTAVAWYGHEKPTLT